MTRQLPDRLLLFRDVMKLTGWSDEALRGAIREYRFPAPMHLSKRRLAWRPEVIEAHLGSLERAALANQEGGNHGS
jgi:predicted DNA-binding transcriptional regulator AlpA